MLRAEVNWDICRECDPCSARLVCTMKAAVQIEADAPAFIELTRCMGCGDCLPACPYGAIALSNVNRPRSVRQN